MTKLTQCVVNQTTFHDIGDYNDTAIDEFGDVFARDRTTIHH